MNAKEATMTILQKMGYEPEYDEDGDIRFPFQLKTIYVIIDEEKNYAIVLLHHFHEIDDDTEAQALTACNKLTRDMRLCKVYLEKDFQHITATCEFYFTDENSLENSISHSLEVLAIIRSHFNDTMRDYMN